jgi:hypothetical protein
MASMAMLNNQRVSHNEKVLFENTIFAGQVCQFHPPQDGAHVFERVQLPNRKVTEFYGLW